jgi:hypothetical protein
LEELPDCQMGGGGGWMGDPDTFSDDGNTNNLSFWPPTPSSFDTNSPYVAMGVAGVLITAIVALLIIRYSYAINLEEKK